MGGDANAHPQGPGPGHRSGAPTLHELIHAGDFHALAHLLEPALHAACRGDGDASPLGAVDWYHATWQRGGACTGFSTFAGGGGAADSPVRVMVKLPVGEVEHAWSVALGGCEGGITPRVFAHGKKLGEHDVSWLVAERLAGPQMPQHMDASQVMELLEAAMQFHARAGQVRGAEGRGAEPNFEQLVEESRRVCKEDAVEHGQHWNELLKKVQRALPALRGAWHHRPIDTWCHGDLHPGNAMRRTRGGGGELEVGACPLVLIDLALVHAGYWAEDAIYLERQYWGHEHLLHGIKPVSTLARMRRERGLATGDYTLLANVRRVLMAACAPAKIGREGSAKYLETAMGMLERLLPQVPHL